MTPSLPNTNAVDDNGKGRLKSRHSSLFYLGMVVSVGFATAFSFSILYTNSDKISSFILLGSPSSSSTNSAAMDPAGLVYQDGGYVSKGATSGAIFTGVPYRTYKGRRVFSDKRGNIKKVKGRKEKSRMTWEKLQSKLGYYKKKNKKNVKEAKPKCTKWAVVTTIFEPTEALKDIASFKEWCIVIAGDNKTSKTWLQPPLQGNPRVFYVSIEEQDQWQKLSGPIGEFVKLLPHNHFARKNVGFLYAILRGAKWMYDFDDDNYLNHEGEELYNEKSTKKFLSLIKNEDALDNVRVIEMPNNKKAFNHHSLMGATIDTSWARGFPLEDIQNTDTYGKVVKRGQTLPMSKIGVIQYCANNNPDIDAIHRLTKPLPMNFKSGDKAADSASTPVLVPQNVYAPYNAQATIHTYDALFAVLLPISVMGRVTDIWRGYFTECLFKDIDLSLVFAPPDITQYRNIHNILGDLESEKDLYLKSGKLVEFLHQYKFSRSLSLEGRMEQLWIDLYERGYIEIIDVELVQRWLEALQQINYKFKSVYH